MTNSTTAASLMIPGNAKRLVLFTDPDGLLSRDCLAASRGVPARSDAWPGRRLVEAPARGTLECLKSSAIPVVLFSARTRAEIELIQQELDISHPFIAENGGALYIPEAYFPFPLSGSSQIAGYDVFRFGKPHRQVVEALHRVAGECGVEVAGFSDMSTDQVARETGMTLMQAGLAKLREYDEPFRIEAGTPASRERFFPALRKAGLSCVRFGRYHHVHSCGEPAAGIRMLREFYDRAWGKVTAVGIGENGAAECVFLSEVDVPIVVRADTPAAGRLRRKFSSARLTASSGPEGWNEALLELTAQWSASAP